MKMLTTLLLAVAMNVVLAADPTCSSSVTSACAITIAPGNLSNIYFSPNAGGSATYVLQMEDLNHPGEKYKALYFSSNLDLFKAWLSMALTAKSTGSSLVLFFPTYVPSGISNIGDLYLP